MPVRLDYCMNFVKGHIAISFLHVVTVTPKRFDGFVPGRPVGAKPFTEIADDDVNHLWVGRVWIIRLISSYGALTLDNMVKRILVSFFAFKQD